MLEALTLGVLQGAGVTIGFCVGGSVYKTITDTKDKIDKRIKKATKKKSHHRR